MFLLVDNGSDNDSLSTFMSSPSVLQQNEQTNSSMENSAPLIELAPTIENLSITQPVVPNNDNNEEHPPIRLKYVLFFEDFIII